MRKNKIFLMVLATAAVCVLFLYRPVKENEIYTREIKLPETSEIQENSVSSEKMVKRAKNTLENVFSVQIDEGQYHTSVIYESHDMVNASTAYGKQNFSYANIDFYDIVTGDPVYIVSCDTTTGEILMVARQYESPGGEAYLSMEELERTAKAFFEKISGMEQSRILYYEDGIQAETYHINITLKDSYEPVVLYLDAYDGTVFYFRKGD